MCQLYGCKRLFTCNAAFNFEAPNTRQAVEEDHLILFKTASLSSAIMIAIKLLMFNVVMIVKFIIIVVIRRHSPPPSSFHLGSEISTHTPEENTLYAPSVSHISIHPSMP
jgi:hypothetical protein